MATSTSRAATKRRSEPDLTNVAWKCFPSPYVMPCEEPRSRSRSRSRGRQPKHAPDSSQAKDKDQWREEASAPSHGAAVTNCPVPDDLVAHQPRPRSRLQKRPSQRKVQVENPTSDPTTMPRPASRARGNSSGHQEASAIPRSFDEALPMRQMSLRENPAGRKEERKKTKKVSLPELKPRPKTSPQENDSNATNNNQMKRNSDGLGSSSSTGSSNATSSNAPRTPRYLPLAPNDPSPLNPLYYIPISSFSDAGLTQVAQIEGEQKDHTIISPDFRPSFRPRKTEHTTDVEETIRPAVVHEALEFQRTEIVQEEITKELHIHHYYTYTQPIKALEVLPARHFIIDPETGEKIEILPPEGWTVPAHIQPYKPDLGGIGMETRHYVVNEQHPKGVLEAAPSHPKKRPSQRGGLSKKASVTGNWTPFPKTR